MEILILLGILLIAGFGAFNIYKERVGAKERFDIQMQISQAQSLMTNPLSLEDCKSIVNQIIQFYCIIENVNKGYFNLTSEYFSTIMDKVIIEIATNSKMALSQEVIRQFGKFVTIDGDDNYLDFYIFHTTKIILLDEIRNRKMVVGKQTNTRPINQPPKKKQSQQNTKKQN